MYHRGSVKKEFDNHQITLVKLFRGARCKVTERANGGRIREVYPGKGGGFVCGFG